MSSVSPSEDAERTRNPCVLVPIVGSSSGCDSGRGGSLRRNDPRDVRLVIPDSFCGDSAGGLRDDALSPSLPKTDEGEPQARA